MGNNDISGRVRTAGRFTALLVALAAASMTFLAGPAAAHDADGNVYYYDDWNGGRGQVTVAPGEWVDLRFRNMCNWWSCSPADNRPSSVRTEGSATILYTEPNFSGTSICVEPHRLVNLPYFMNNQVSSVRVMSGMFQEQRACPSYYEGPYHL
jgi:hypothetical protein